MWDLIREGLQLFANVHERFLIVPWWSLPLLLAFVLLAGWAVGVVRGRPAEAIRRRALLDRLLEIRLVQIGWN